MILLGLGLGSRLSRRRLFLLLKLILQFIQAIAAWLLTTAARRRVMSAVHSRNSTRFRYVRLQLFGCHSADHARDLHIERYEVCRCRENSLAGSEIVMLQRDCRLLRVGRAQNTAADAAGI